MKRVKTYVYICTNIPRSANRRAAFLGRNIRIISSISCPWEDGLDLVSVFDDARLENTF